MIQVYAWFYFIFKLLQCHFSLFFLVSVLEKTLTVKQLRLEVAAMVVQEC